METERKILKVENAEQSLAFLLMAKNVKFAYSYGVFYIFDKTAKYRYYEVFPSQIAASVGISKDELLNMTADEFAARF